PATAHRRPPRTAGHRARRPPRTPATAHPRHRAPPATAHAGHRAPPAPSPTADQAHHETAAPPSPHGSLLSRCPGLTGLWLRCVMLEFCAIRWILGTR
ncbi:hypothetical protein E1261_44925, partial [Kribbella albertanoniae]